MSKLKSAPVDPQPLDVDYLCLAGIAASSKATTAVCTAFAAPARS